MASTDTLINDVSDTSIWVAYYRDKESKRSDALFNDPLAELLIGERGKKIAEDMKSASRYSEWTVIIRTVVIDAYIHQLIAEGVDTIVNLGAGLDTRPYRMNLPAALNWIEVDYPNIIDHKNTVLRSEIPKCRLSRVAVDLADDTKRKEFLQEISATSKKIAVITEGVVIYLTEKQTSALAEDLEQFPSFAYWIVEYINPRVYPYLQSAARANKLKNAPFQFFPSDWLGFFKQRGWVPKELRFHGEEGFHLGRPMPTPRRGFFFRLFVAKKMLERTKRMTGFMLLQREN